MLWGVFMAFIPWVGRDAKTPRHECRSALAGVVDPRLRDRLDAALREELLTPASQSQAAPRTPLESPCSFWSIRVVTSSVKTCG